MPLLVGIDEAGYGPLLGPLVIGASLWRAPVADPPPDLWQELHHCVGRSAARGQWRLVVADSKEVYDPKVGPASLERTVLAFAGVAGLPTGSAHALLGALTGRDVWTDCGAPWYHRLDRPLPCDRVLAQAGTAGQRLRDAHASGPIGCAGLMSEVVTEDFFNRRVQQTQNKAAVLVEHILRLLQRVARVAGSEEVSVVIDRLGGRTDYCGLLREAYPDRHVHIEEVSELCSRYRLTGAGADWRFAFVVEADRQHLPVALASMLAKYVRELIMEQLNAYWRGFAPALRPTAGYYKDAQRFLRDIAPHIPTSGLTAESFVRAR